MNPLEQNQQQPSLVEQQVKKQSKKATKKLLKKGLKVTYQLSKKFIFATVKTIVAAVATLIAPYLGIITLVGLALLAVYMIIALAFTAYPEVLDEKAQAVRQNIIDIVSDYEAVPYELIVAGLQLEDSVNVLSNKEIKHLAEILEVDRSYKEIELSSESYSVDCIDDRCDTSPTITNTTVEEVVDSEHFWDKLVRYDYDTSLGDWVTSGRYKESICKKVLDKDGEEKEECTVYSGYTKTRTETYHATPNETMDYTKFEEAFMMEPFEYSVNDLYAVEVFFAITGQSIFYKEWKAGLGFSNDMFNGVYDFNVIPGSNIPSEFFPVYMKAQAKYGVAWNFLSAIHYVETKFSTHQPMVSYAGAEGHTQWMPCSWIGWSYPGCKGSNGYVNIPDSIKYNPAQIKKYGGLGVDANNNGIASTFEIEDAIFATANYLARSGFTKDIEKAIYTYNHSSKYVSDVMSYAQQFKAEASIVNDAVSNSLGFAKVASGRLSSPFGWRTINGNRVYHYGVDIANSVGTPIYATANGKVRLVHGTCPKNGYYGSSCGGGWGNYVLITHNVNGQVYETVSAHLNSVNVRVGQEVTQGQMIGAMGNSGSSTGPHLHFEIHKGKRQAGRAPNQTVLNPALYIPLE